MFQLKLYPFISVMSLAGLLVFLGLVDVVIGLVGIWMYQSTSLIAVLSYTPIMPGMLFVITGTTGVSGAQSPAGYKRAGLTYGFLSLCIWCAILAASSIPATAYVLIMHVIPLNNMLLTVMEVVLLITNSLAFILATIGATVSCCCAPVGGPTLA